jgi:hypothetical protein
MISEASKNLTKPITSAWLLQLAHPTKNIVMRRYKGVVDYNANELHTGLHHIAIKHLFHCTSEFTSAVDEGVKYRSSESTRVPLHTYYPHHYPV